MCRLLMRPAGAPPRQLMHTPKRGAGSTIYAGAVPAMFSTRTQLGAEEKGRRQGRKAFVISRRSLFSAATLRARTSLRPLSLPAKGSALPSLAS